MGVCLNFMLSNTQLIHISFLSILSNIFFKAMNKIWKTSQIFTHCNSVRIVLLRRGNKQLQKSQRLNKADVYFLFILLVQHRSVGDTAHVNSSHSQTDRGFILPSFFLITEAVGRRRKANCALALVFMHRNNTCHSYVSHWPNQITWLHPQ